MDQGEDGISELEDNIEELNCHRKECEKFEKSTQKKRTRTAGHCEKTKALNHNIDEGE